MGNIAKPKPVQHQSTPEESRARPMRAAKKAKKHHEEYSDENDDDEEYVKKPVKQAAPAPVHQSSKGPFNTPGNINVASIPVQRLASDAIANPRIKFVLPSFRCLAFMLDRYQFTTAMANVAAQAVVVGKCSSIIEYHNIHSRAYTKLFQSQQVCVAQRT